MKIPPHMRSLARERIIKLLDFRAALAPFPDVLQVHLDEGAESYRSPGYGLYLHFLRHDFSTLYRKAWMSDMRRLLRHYADATLVSSAWNLPGTGSSLEIRNKFSIEINFGGRNLPADSFSFASVTDNMNVDASGFEALSDWGRQVCYIHNENAEASAAVDRVLELCSTTAQLRKAAPELNPFLPSDLQERTPTRARLPLELKEYNPWERHGTRVIQLLAEAKLVKDPNVATRVQGPVEVVPI